VIDKNLIKKYGPIKIDPEEKEEPWTKMDNYINSLEEQVTRDWKLTSIGNKEKPAALGCNKK